MSLKSFANLHKCLEPHWNVCNHTEQYAPAGSSGFVLYIHSQKDP